MTEFESLADRFGVELALNPAFVHFVEQAAVLKWEYSDEKLVEIWKQIMAEPGNE